MTKTGLIGVSMQKVQGASVHLESNASCFYVLFTDKEEIQIFHGSVFFSNQIIKAVVELHSYLVELASPPGQ